jgi:hypothetical protein
MTHKRSLDQFYTNPVIASNCLGLLQEFVLVEGILFDCWLEPSAGTGSFYTLLPENKKGFDLDPKCDGIVGVDFLGIDLSPVICATVGNPPFGKNSSLAIKFFNKCAEHSVVIGFILPKTFKKQSVVSKLNKNFHLRYELELPENSFLFDEKEFNVPCVFQIWHKLGHEREDEILPLTHVDFYFTNRESASVAVQRVGVNAGKVKTEYSGVAASSHYFIRCSEQVTETLKKIDWVSVKYNTAGNPSISKGELVKLYSQLKEDK